MGFPCTKHTQQIHRKIHLVFHHEIHLVFHHDMWGWFGSRFFTARWAPVDWNAKGEVRGGAMDKRDRDVRCAARKVGNAWRWAMERLWLVDVVHGRVPSLNGEF